MVLPPSLKDKRDNFIHNSVLFSYEQALSVIYDNFMNSSGEKQK